MKNGEVRAHNAESINLSILDFKYKVERDTRILMDTINLSILDFK